MEGSEEKVNQQQICSILCSIHLLDGLCLSISDIIYLKHAWDNFGLKLSYQI